MTNYSLKIYSPKKAWMLAAVYFAVCLSISAYFGVLQALLFTPFASASQFADGLWWAATLLVSAYVVFAYGYFWPKGTIDHDRPLHIGWVLVFGVLWGLCEGQLVLVGYRAIESVGLSDVWNICLMFVAYSMITAVWHSQFWDIHVSPDHNVFEWNVRKVVVAHAPFLLLALIHLANHGNALLFVVWQIAALTLSTYFMRFPAPGDPETPAHDGQGIRRIDT